MNGRKFLDGERVEWWNDDPNELFEKLRTGKIIEWTFDERSREIKYLVLTDNGEYVVVPEKRLESATRSKS